MAALKYIVIKDEAQYKEYCSLLEQLVMEGGDADEIDLLTLLIEKWDEEHNTFHELDPVQLLKSLMQEKDMSGIELAKAIGVSKGLVSDILRYQKGFSKEVIRELANLFKVSQEAFNRPYPLQVKSKVVTGEGFAVQRQGSYVVRTEGAWKTRAASAAQGKFTTQAKAVKAAKKAATGSAVVKATAGRIK